MSLCDVGWCSSIFHPFAARREAHAGFVGKRLIPGGQLMDFKIVPFFFSFRSMTGENRQLVTDGPVEFEK